MRHRFIFQVGEAEEGWRLRGFLRAKRVSSSLLRRLKREGGIRVNGVEVFLDTLLRKGDVVEIQFVEEVTDPIPPEPVPFTILMEDEDLLIINKPSGIAVHPTLNYLSGTLANGVSHYWRMKGEDRMIRFVNRLDKETSGIILVAKNAYAHYFLSQEARSGEYRKWYHLFVHGIMKEDEGRIELPIGLSEGSMIKREIRKEGQTATTKFRVIQRYLRQDVTLVMAELLTGRTHQIRVHFAHLGHPLLGDDLYGGKKELIHRQALHASRIKFLHPRSGLPEEMDAPWPKDLLSLRERLESSFESER